MHKSEQIFTTKMTSANEFATYIGSPKEYSQKEFEPSARFCTGVVLQKGVLNRLYFLSHQSLFLLSNCNLIDHSCVEMVAECENPIPMITS